MEAREFDSESKTTLTGENFLVVLRVPEYRDFITRSGLGWAAAPMFM